MVRQAIAEFLVGFGESTRDAYSLDLRQWMRWCASHDLAIFEVRRAHIELFARWLEEEDGNFTANLTFDRDGQAVSATAKGAVDCASAGLGVWSATVLPKD